MDLLEKRQHKSKPKAKNYLILFTESQELYIIDALTGFMHINKTFKGKKMIHVTHKLQLSDTIHDKERNKNIYLIFKDTAETFSSLRLNLETVELEEDNTIIDQFSTLEEIRVLSEKLVGADASLTNDDLIYGELDLVNKYADKYMVQSINNNLYGIKLNRGVNNKLDISLAWNVIIKKQAGKDFKILDYKYPNIHDNLIITYHSGGKIFYKYIDSNTLLLLSTYDNRTLIVSILKITNGKILHQSYINNVDFSQKILPLFEENTIVISYTKKEKTVTRNEIYVIEMMKREIEYSLITLFERIFKINILSGEGENIQNQNENLQEFDLVFLTQTFIIPKRVKQIYFSKSKTNVSNKFLIMVFENNQVFVIEKRGISPRRPIVKDDKGKAAGAPPVIDPNLNSPYIDPESPPYNPIVNIDYKYIVNIDFVNDQIDNIRIAPTEFESTFMLCTEGINISCYKVAPDKTFDTMTLHFSYSLIAMFIISIMVYILFNISLLLIWLENM